MYPSTPLQLWWLDGLTGHLLLVQGQAMRRGHSVPVWKYCADLLGLKQCPSPSVLGTCQRGSQGAGYNWDLISASSIFGKSFNLSGGSASPAFIYTLPCFLKILKQLFFKKSTPEDMFFRERGRGEERKTERQTDREKQGKREKHRREGEASIVASHVCSDLGSNLPPFGIRDTALTSRATQPRLKQLFIYFLK